MWFEKALLSRKLLVGNFGLIRGRVFFKYPRAYKCFMKGVESERVQTPMSSAGIMRFFDVSGGGQKIKPMVVIGASIAFIVIELFLKVIR